MDTAMNHVPTGARLIPGMESFANKTRYKRMSITVRLVFAVARGDFCLLPLRSLSPQRNGSTESVRGTSDHRS